MSSNTSFFTKNAYEQRIKYLKKLIFCYFADTDENRNTFNITQEIEFDIVDAVLEERYEDAIRLLEKDDFIKCGHNVQNRLSRAFVFGKLLKLDDTNANFGELCLSDFVSVGYSTDYFNIDSILPENISQKNILVKEEVAAELGNFVIANYTFDEMSLCTSLSSIHPHIVAHTLHELFKILLEWQWAYHELGNREDIAVAANNALLSMGLDVRNADSHSVVKDLLTLPDMHVAQFLMGNTNITMPDTDPIVPNSFKFWAAKKDIIKFYKREHATLYTDLVNLQQHIVKLQEIS